MAKVKILVSYALFRTKSMHQLSIAAAVSTSWITGTDALSVDNIEGVFSSDELHSKDLQELVPLGTQSWHDHLRTSALLSLSAFTPVGTIWMKDGESQSQISN